MINKTDFEVQKPSAESAKNWRFLLKFGGFAALVAGIGFRRNLGAEVSLFGGIIPPTTTEEWFALFQEDWLLGLAFFDVFDIVNYLLIGLMLLALYIPYRRSYGSQIVTAFFTGFIGIVTYITSNMAFTMLSLSNQYATSTTDAQRTALLVAGEAILAQSQSTGYFVSFILLAITSLIVSVVMLEGNIFSKKTAYAGVLASLCDFSYFIALVNLPEICVLFVSAAGLFLMIWHILVGRRLYRLSQEDNI
jgi:hypothetical protein